MTRDIKISKTLSHLLRHDPKAHGVNLQPGGWVDMNDLVESLRAQNEEWTQLHSNDVIDLVMEDDKGRYEFDGERVRAVYGHSIEVQGCEERSMPPARLFHGTTPAAWESIRVEGLQPRQRQRVHLAVDRETAVLVAKRRTKTPVVLLILAEEASRAGVCFYRGSKSIWTAESIAASFLRVEPCSSL